MWPFCKFFLLRNDLNVQMIFKFFFFFVKAHKQAVASSFDWTFCFGKSMWLHQEWTLSVKVVTDFVDEYVTAVSWTAYVEDIPPHTSCTLGTLFLGYWPDALHNCIVIVFSQQVHCHNAFLASNCAWLLLHWWKGSRAHACVTIKPAAADYTKGSV